MIGFDSAGVAREIRLDADHFPVMLVVIGKQVGDLRPSAYRHPVSEFVKLETLEGKGL